MGLEEVLSELEKHTGSSREELMKKIEEKKKEFSDLVSLEGAAYLIANELGLDLLEKKRRKLEIKNVVSGMRNVNLIGRIFNTTPFVEFERQNGSRGRVVNIFVGDDTGFVRIPLWNDQAKLMENGDLKLGDSIQITNGMAREGIYGGMEVVIGKYGTVNKIELEDLPSLDYLREKYLGAGSEKKAIKDLVPGRAEICGTIVHVFKGKIFFEICPICSNTLVKKDEKPVCSQHGEIEPSQALLLTAIVDDGTANIRVVFFRGQAEKALQLKTKDLEQMDEEGRYNLIKERLLGRELQLTGRVKKNKIFDRIEFIVSDVKDLNVLEESKKLVKELGG
jgi:replication factor A1